MMRILIESDRHWCYPSFIYSSFRPFCQHRKETPRSTRRIIISLSILPLAGRCTGHIDQSDNQSIKQSIKSIRPSVNHSSHSLSPTDKTQGSVSVCLESSLPAVGLSLGLHRIPGTDDNSKTPSWSSRYTSSCHLPGLFTASRLSPPPPLSIRYLSIHRSLPHCS